jgi:hypothetical protein
MEPFAAGSPAAAARTRLVAAGPGSPSLQGGRGGVAGGSGGGEVMWGPVRRRLRLVHASL